MLSLLVIIIISLKWPLVFVGYVLVNTLRFYLSVCPCVMDVGVAITNLRVVCKIITCVPAVTEMAINFLEIVKAAAGRDTQHCRLHEGFHCGRLPSH